jgi:hypothetical protein
MIFTHPHYYLNIHQQPDSEILISQMNAEMQANN